MRTSYYCLLLILCAGCAQNTQQNQQGTDSALAVTDNTTATPAESPLPEKIIAERVAGEVSLLDTINGKVIATLYDNTLLNAGTPTQDWMAVGLETEINPLENKSMLIKKGHKLIMNGAPAGEVLQDIHLETTGQNTKGKKTGLFYAYIPADKVKAGSVIETALATYLQQHKGRLLPDMQPFIKQFQLEATGYNEPYQEYANYENSVDDPSPAYRIILVFYKNKLIGVVGSRPIKVTGTTTHQLDRDFHGYFFEDTDQKLQEKYIKTFNSFINSVD